MEFARPIMWNVPLWAEMTLYAMIPMVVVVFVAGVVWRIRQWSLGQAESDAPTVLRQLAQTLRPRRAGDLFKTVFGQSRLAPDRFSWIMHQTIFWGMLVLFFGTALATIDQDFTNLLFDWPLLGGWFYLLFELALDVFGVVLIAGVVLAGYRRYISRPLRLKTRRQDISLWDSFPLLTCLLLIAITGFLVEGLRIAQGNRLDAELAAAEGEAARLAQLEQAGFADHLHMGAERKERQLRQIAESATVFPAAMMAPVGAGLARLAASLSADSLRLTHQVLWWSHALLAFGLIVSIPLTKAFHLIASPANLLLHDDHPPGRLPVIAASGVSHVRDFTWRQLMQADACTWCGKCEEACPGFATGFPLSPRDVVQTVAAQLLRTRRRGNGNGQSLHNTLLPENSLWACCTCRACEDVCPVGVEQPRMIVDLRRYLVDQGQIDEGLQEALLNWQRYGNSFGQSARKRPEWAKSLPFPLKDARKEEVEYLWFTGDYASFDQRVSEVTRAVARVLHQAGVDVGLLMEKEQNAGNDVRRIGEEGLFELLREKNLKELEKAKFRKILTSDPHTVNTLKNEYVAGEAAGADGGRAVLGGRPVLHYAELFDELLREGVLHPTVSFDQKVTYHDPCYLGRFNGIYEAPRRVLRAIGAELIEMPRNRRNSFCCGAGGGRIWMKDTPGIEQRPAENRVHEALSLPGVRCLVVACPKDLIMFRDAVKTVGAEDQLRVADLGELVDEATRSSTEPTTNTGT